MKTSSKSFDKSKTYIKNGLSDQEMEEASEVFLSHKGPYLTLDQIFKIEKQKAKQASKVVKQ